MVSESASLALAKRAKKAASHGSSRSPLLSTVLIAGSAALLGIAIYTIAEPNSARSYAAK